jgi:hypothetical protein
MRSPNEPLQSLDARRAGGASIFGITGTSIFGTAGAGGRRIELRPTRRNHLLRRGCAAGNQRPHDHTKEDR